MKCEADFKRCKGVAKWKFTAMGCNATLKVCDAHKLLYEKLNIVQTVEELN